MKNDKLVIFAVLFVSYLFSCKIKNVTFYDIDKKNVVGNSNYVINNSDLQFSFTILQPEIVGSLEDKKLLLQAVILKKNESKIQSMKIFLKPNKNSIYLLPYSVAINFDDSSKSYVGKDLEFIKSRINNDTASTINMYYDINIESTDSLYAKFEVKYFDTLNTKTFSVEKLLIKGYFYSSFTR